MFPAGPAIKTGSNDFANATAFASISIGDSGYTMSGNSIKLGIGGIACNNAAMIYAQSALNMPFILPAQRSMTFTGVADCELSFSGLISGPGGWQIVSTPSTPGRSGIVHLYNGGNSYAGGTSVASSYVGARASGVLGSGPVVITYAGGDGNDVVITAQARSLRVSVAGSGVGNVSGTGVAAINCGNGGVVCVQSNTPGAIVTLTATANVGSTFIGWIGGGCLLNNPCNVFINATQTVQATFAPTSTGPFDLDIDRNTPFSAGPFRAPTDGVMILRYMLGFTGNAITLNAMGTQPNRAAALIPTHLINIRPLLDVDGDGEINALTDGLLIVRYLLGTTGTALTTGALGPNATRASPAAIVAYLNLITPP